MENAIKFSLIIPVYNVEKYLEQCIESCENQDIPHDEYEVIAINDGSNDKSFEILEELGNKYKNIRIISQANQGQSVARNIGLNVAKGQYIWFIDSDDWIDSNVLKGIYNIMRNYELDALHLAYQMVNDKGKWKLSPKIEEVTKIYSGPLFLDRMLTDKFYAWSFIFNRHFWDKVNLRFTEGIYFEDLDLIPQILLEVNRVCAYKKTVYFYRQRQSSTVHSVNYKLIDDLFLVCSRYKNSLSSQHLSLLNRRILSRILASSTISYLVLLAKQNNDSMRHERLQKALTHYKTLHLNRRLNIAKNICILIFNLAPMFLFKLLCIKGYLKNRL